MYCSTLWDRILKSRSLIIQKNQQTAMPFNFIAESMPSKVVVPLLDLAKSNVLGVFLIKLFILTSSWVYMQFWEKIQRDPTFPILYPVSSSDNILQNYSLFSQPECWLSFMFKKCFLSLSHGQSIALYYILSYSV